ncbi:MAG TPA: hypothetical protein VN775_06345 [Opitutaceae bacterium]|nr:hypothetical protein [Opitutaceae bacterium]
MEAAARGEPQVPVAGRNPAPTIGARLPPLDELVEKVPAAVRDILDDLFRAKFTAVRKYTDASGPVAPP